MKRLLAVVLFAAVVLCFTGVFALGQAEPLQKVKVGISPVISSSAFYLAKMRGYFTEQGLDVELIPFGKSGPAIIPFVATDQFQVGGGSVSPGMFNAIAQGNKVVAQGTGRQESEAHRDNWLKCVRSRELPNADIEIGHRSALHAHLGNLGVRLGGRRLVFDGATESIVGDEEANALLTREYREPYVVPKEV